jgi:chromosome condensin MukBEF complex kleisin-like MukF subunit
MGKDHFNALILLYVHKDIEIDISKVVEMYARQYPRRMHLEVTNLTKISKIKRITHFWNTC